jgi:hypothetical protein
MPPVCSTSNPRYAVCAQYIVFVKWEQDQILAIWFSSPGWALLSSRYYLGPRWRSL